VPAITALSNARYQHEPHWYCNFRYDEERARGLDFTEDLASPGVFEWDLSAGEAVWLLAASDSPGLEIQRDMSAVSFLNCLRENERLRRKEFPSRLHQAADAYIAQGRSGKTILAGYPWFTDWGRDTFIALRGFCLASGRLDDAREILLTWASAVSEGMLPNRFPDHGEQPEFNSVDASLWYVIAVDEFLTACKTARKGVSAREKELLRTAVEEILEGYAKGTRFGIRMDADGLLAAGMPGSQLTWMDAKIGDWVITPRTGKPVEVQALWLNALKVGSNFSPGWKTHFQRGLAAFKARFWNETSGYLYDVIDCNHEPGTMDPAFRPNQIFAVGGLPLNLLEQDQAERVVSAVEERLWTPLGLPSLAPGSPGYAPRYSGGVRERDSVYHQGTVWPWLIGPFIEAWVRVRGATVEAKHEARRKFLQPLLAHLNDGGVGHVSEIADADAPHTPRGCPFQAWSVGELLRADAIVLASEQRPLKAAPRSIFASARATRPAGAGRRKFESA
jgi:predicted glycogen debranching enzyme